MTKLFTIIVDLIAVEFLFCYFSYSQLKKTEIYLATLINDFQNSLEISEDKYFKIFVVLFVC